MSTWGPRRCGVAGISEHSRLETGAAAARRLPFGRRDVRGTWGAPGGRTPGAAGRAQSAALGPGAPRHAVAARAGAEGRLGSGDGRVSRAPRCPAEKQRGQCGGLPASSRLAPLLAAAKTSLGVGGAALPRSSRRAGKGEARRSRETQRFSSCF